MQNIDLDSPSLFINREMSWLEFNDRVLREGLSADVPLMERVKFLSIVSSNLDEFFMIRVAGLRQQVSSGVNTMDVSGMSPTQQLEAIAERTRRLVAEQSAGIVEATTLLCEQGLCLLNSSDLSPTQRKFIDTYFDAEVLPLLTPLAAEGLNPFPILPGLALNLGLMIPVEEDAEVQERIAIVPIPLCLPRFINIPGEKAMCLVPIEQVIAGNIGKLFGLPTTPASTVFRITRDADVAIKESQAADMISVVEKAVRARRRRSAVRLEISKGADPRLMKWLTEGEYLPERGVYEIDGLIDPSSLMQIFKMRGFERLHEPDWPPQVPQDLIGSENIFQTLQERDVLLFHPYETFAPVVQMIQQAADDPGVLAIKQTLYRTSGDSPIIAALARAAERGKQVTVLVELKARFDEANNVNWARTLEDAGCHVIYGISGVKTHAKLSTLR